MKPKLKLIAITVGLLLSGLFAVGFTHDDAFAIRRDLRLGMSPCAVARPVASPQTVRVAIVAISDATKQALRSRFSWHEPAHASWHEAIPWFSDLISSTEFEPIFRHALENEHTGKASKFKSHYDTSSWSYDLTLEEDRNILWIVRDTPATHPIATK